MRNRKTVTKAVCVASILLILFLLAGCGNSGQQPNAQLQSAQQQQSQEKEPEKLKNIEARLETLIETLGGPSVIMEDEKGKKGGESGQKEQNDQQQGTKQQDTKQQGTKQQGTQQQGTQQQGTQQQGTQQQGTKQQGTQQQGTQQQGTKQDQQKGEQQKGNQQKDAGKWSEIDMLISNLHYQWNDLMPEIAKKGADMKLVDNFDNALNNLTTTVASKDSKKILSAANTLYSYVPDLYSLYRVKMSPEAKRMVFYTRSIILEAEKDNWEQVEKDNEALEKSWSLFRNTLEKEQQQIGDKLDFSIYELSKVASEKNKQLADIKGRIALSNIKELQKSFEDKK